MDTYTIYIGPEHVVKIKFDPLTTLSFVRSALGAKLSDNYRFLNYQCEHYHYSDMVVGAMNESFLPLGAIAGSMNSIYLADVTATQKVDFIGIRTSWFWNRLLGVRVRLNPSPEARQHNRGKMAPLMLTKVQLANPNITGADSLEHVIFCENDTAVHFEVNSWGAAGFGFGISSASGDPIMDVPLYIPFSTCKAENRAIGILSSHVALSDPGIDGQLIRFGTESSRRLPDGSVSSHQKIVITSWNLSSYTDKEGKRFECEQPVPEADPQIWEESPEQYPAFPSIRLPDKNASRIGQANVLADVREDRSLDGVLGQMVLHVFSFQSRKDAQEIFRGVNAPAQPLWVVR